MFIIFKVDCDGGRLGHIWRYALCLDAEARDRVIAEYTKPIEYSDGSERFDPETIDDKLGWVCWRAFTFVYAEEVEFRD